MMSTKPAAGIPAILRAGVTNIQDGAIDGTDDSRLRRQLATAAAQNLDAFGLRFSDRRARDCRDLRISAAGMPATVAEAHRALAGAGVRWSG